MEIILKNGEKLNIEVNGFVLEYLENYKGGLEQILLDIETRGMHVVNYVMYAIVSSNYPTKLTFRQAVGLVRLDDYESILEFVVKNIPKRK